MVFIEDTDIQDDVHCDRDRFFMLPIALERWSDGVSIPPGFGRDLHTRFQILRGVSTVLTVTAPDNVKPGARM